MVESSELNNPKGKLVRADFEIQKDERSIEDWIEIIRRRRQENPNDPTIHGVTFTIAQVSSFSKVTYAGENVPKTKPLSWCSVLVNMEKRGILIERKKNHRLVLHLGLEEDELKELRKYL